MRFLDLTQLEQTFPSSSKIRAVYAFVRDCLREDVKPIKFILCAFLVRPHTDFKNSKLQRPTHRPVISRCRIPTYAISPSQN